MSKFSKVLTIIAVLAGVVGLGILIGWLGVGGRPVSVQLPPAPVDSPPATPEHPVTPGPIPHARPPDPKPGPQESTNSSQLAVAPPAGAETNLLENWSDRVDEILTSDSQIQDKTKQMLDLFPHVPEEGQVEVAQHLSNLVGDENYGTLSKYLVDPSLPAPVLEVLVGDALNRRNSLKLPVLLEIAQEPKHPKAGEAKELLGIFLEADYGQNWPQWQSKLEQWLKENPD